MKQLFIFILVLVFHSNISSAALSPPMLLLPDQNQNKVSTRQVEFFWTSVDSASKYILILSDDPYFKTSPILYTTTNDTFLLADVQLDSGTTYFWRVASLNGKDTSQTSFRNIFTTPFPKIHAPVIIYPKHDTIDSYQIKLSWEYQKYMKSAFIELSKDNQFDSVISSQTVYNESFLNIHNSYLDGSKLFWRIRGSNPDTSCGWSETGWMQFRLKYGPEIISPKSGDTNITLQPKIIWLSADSATGYFITLIDNENNDTVIFKSGITSDTSIDLPQNLTLQYDRYYTLKIISKFGMQTTLASSVIFRTIAPPEPFTKSIVLIYPDSVKPVTNPKPIFVWHKETNADSYELWVSDTSKIEDATRVKLNVDEYKDTVYSLSTTSLRPNKDYYWRVRGINLSGKGQWSDVWMFRTSNFSDVEDVSKQFDFAISPNPASDFIDVFVGTRRAVSNQCEVRIYNVLGEIQTTPNLTPALPASGEGARIDVSAFAPGIYFVRIEEIVQKFIKL